MATFRDFHEWLFPGDHVPAVRNPAPLPNSAVEILEEVSCKTGIDIQWLSKSARLVLDGLAGARCLWFLHGARGEIRTQVKIPEDLVDDLAGVITNAVKDIERKGGSNPQFDIRWAEGVINEVSGKGRTTKLGKWLKRYGASPKLIKAFETRQLPYFEWAISAHPFDVLTMSFNRPWTSCMRPGGAAELGPLTDMAAGSAVMFFYRPGADQPCGRMLLRPLATRDNPVVVSAQVVYGVGPGKKAVRFGHEVTLLDEYSIAAVLNPLLIDGVEYGGNAKICVWGKEGLALTRDIYSDTDNSYCKQSDEMYDDAYENLNSLQWPDAKLYLGDFALRAGEAASSVGKRGPKLTLTQAAREVAENAMSSIGLGSLIDFEIDLMNQNSQNIDYDAIYELLGREAPEDSYYDSNEIWRVYLDVLGESYSRLPNDFPVKIVVYDNNEVNADQFNANEDLAHKLHENVLDEVESKTVREFIASRIENLEDLIDDGADVRFAIIPDDVWSKRFADGAIAVFDMPYSILRDVGYFQFNW